MIPRPTGHLAPWGLYTRDIKSSLYIESRAGLARTYTPVGHNVRPTLLAVVDEAGTITAKPSTSSAVGSPTLYRLSYDSKK